MTRTFTASVLVLAIALTGMTATPLRAGNNNDLGRFVAGAIILFSLSKAIEGNKRNRASVSRDPHYPTIYPLPKPERVKKRLPSECFFRLRTDRGTRGVYGKICLGEIMRRADRLPRACQDTVRVRYGRRADVYSASCLREHGYRVVSRRN